MSLTRTIDQLFASLLSEDRKAINPIKTNRLVLLETPYCISTDASFLIHHLIAYNLKINTRVVLVSFLNGFKHYSSIGLKLGINLTTSIKEGTLTFIDCFSQSDGVLVSNCDSKDVLSHLSARLQDCIAQHKVSCPHAPLTLLIDDYSTPVMLGLSLVRALDLVFSTRALLETTLDVQSSVCVHVSALGELESPEIRLVRHLAAESDVILTVEGLASGVCKEVHGKLISRRRSHHAIDWHREECHYKLEDRGVKLFAIGTASSVL